MSINWEIEVNTLLGILPQTEESIVVVEIPEPKDDKIILMSDGSFRIYGYEENKIIPNIMLARDIVYSIYMLSIGNDKEVFRLKWNTYNKILNIIFEVKDKIFREHNGEIV